MEKRGINFKKEVTPTKMEKVDGDKILVTFSDGSSDTYDTVLAAVGRRADTDKLGLEAAGVNVNPKNGKIYTKFEQSNVPNIYAVGDVMEGCPELTPVAIQAGQLLARRLFDYSTEPMDYVNICTTVFTPIITPASVCRKRTPGNNSAAASRCTFANSCRWSGPCPTTATATTPLPKSL